MVKRVQLTVLIEVSGGVVQRVASDKKTDVYLIDHDDLDGGECPDRVKMPYVADFVRNIDKEVGRLLEPYRKGTAHEQSRK